MLFAEEDYLEESREICVPDIGDVKNPVWTMKWPDIACVEQWSNARSHLPSSLSLRTIHYLEIRMHAKAHGFEDSWSVLFEVGVDGSLAFAGDVGGHSMAEEG